MRLTSLLLLLCLVAPAAATQPECTGDRHYDGVGCCPAVIECPEPTVCPPPACPDPAPCQPVTVECKDGNTQIINVDRCPDAPTYVICNGPHKKPKKNDVWIAEYQGWYRCPGRGVPPHKVLLPKLNGSYEQ